MEILNYDQKEVRDILDASQKERSDLWEQIIAQNDQKVEESMDGILNRAEEMTHKNYGYWVGKNKYVCDTFVKKVFADAGKKTFEWVYATPNMFKKEKPTQTLRFGDNGVLQKSDIIPGSVLFFVDKKNFCGHVDIFAGNKNGYPQIYDATKKSWVSKRILFPTEAQKIYYKTII